MDSMRRFFGFFCVFVTGVTVARANGFVEEVACTGNSMTIVVNKTDPDVIKWIRDNSARPIVYVYGHKDRTPCGMALKATVGSENVTSSAFYNFTIPYGPACSVYLTDLEPSFQTAETTVAIENNAAFDSNNNGIRINHVFCLYTKQVETLRINDVTNNNEVVASVGGKPKPKVQMLFRDPEGRPLKAAKFGDPVGLYLMLSPDNAYKAINPKHCMFSDREQMEEPEAKTLTFVQSNCPVTELSEVIRPVQDLNEEIYFTHFQAFRFGERPTVYAHCKVEVCLEQDNCAKKDCYPKVSNSSVTAESLRLRFRRNAGAYEKKTSDGTSANAKSLEEVALSNALTVLDEQQSVSVVGTAKEMCIDQRAYQGLFILVGVLAILLLMSLGFSFCQCRKLKRYKKTAMASASLPSVATYLSRTPSNATSSVYNRQMQGFHGQPRRTAHLSPGTSTYASGTDFGTMRSEILDVNSVVCKPQTAASYMAFGLADTTAQHTIPRVRMPQ